MSTGKTRKADCYPCGARVRASHSHLIVYRRRYYTAFFSANVQFIETNAAYFAPLTGSSMTTVMLFSTSDLISQKLEAHFQENREAGYSLCISPTAAARFLTGAMAQSARYLIEHREDADRENLEANMKILIEKLFSDH